MRSVVDQRWPSGLFPTGVYLAVDPRIFDPEETRKILEKDRYEVGG